MGRRRRDRQAQISPEVNTRENAYTRRGVIRGGTPALLRGEEKSKGKINRAGRSPKRDSDTVDGATGAVLWTFAWGSTAQMESQVAGYELATAAWGAGGTIEWQWDMTALFEETGSPCSIHCAVHTEDAAWVRSRASKSATMANLLSPSGFRNRSLTTASAYATLSVLPPRKHETGGHYHVVEQHPFGQGDSSQQERQHLLSADHGEIAVHHSMAPSLLLLTKTRVVGESFPSLFSRVGVASPGTPEEGTATLWDNWRNTLPHDGLKNRSTGNATQAQRF